MNMTVYDDPMILPNLTVWENAQSLERFVWQTVHGRFYRRRAEWFEPVETPLVLWWVPAGTRPRLQDGVERLRPSQGARPERVCLRLGEPGGSGTLEDTARRDRRGPRPGHDRLGSRPNARTGAASTSTF